MPHQSYYLAVCLSVMLVACGPSARDFEHKTKIGVFGENQGMVTFEGYLYADSTFFIPESVFSGPASGVFKIHNNSITFTCLDGSGAYFHRVTLKLDSTNRHEHLFDSNGVITYVGLY